jgi:protein involved in polysaccharide export with SLBB domain
MNHPVPLRVRWVGDCFRPSLPDLLVLGILLVSVTSCAPPGPSPAQRIAAALADRTEPVLSPGDVIRIDVWRQPTFSGDFGIAGDGSIRHPLYQTVRITGVPLTSARERLRTFLRDFVTDPQFVVTPLLFVTVGGAVEQPNRYHLPPEVTVAGAVAGAGGATEDGRLDRVRLLRAGGEIVMDLTQPRSEVGRLPIKSGDQILVGRRRNVWREYIGPVASVAGATAAIVNAVLRNRN